MVKKMVPEKVKEKNCIQVFSPVKANSRLILINGVCPPAHAVSQVIVKVNKLI